METISNLNLALASVNQLPLDWTGNRDRILASAAAFAQDNPGAGADTGPESAEPDVLLFPELCVTGYGCEDAFHSPDLTGRALALTENIAAELGRLLPRTLALVGLPVRHRGRIYNCMAVLCGGQVRAFIAKQNLPGDGVHYEPRWFSEFRLEHSFPLPLPGGGSAPMGAMLLSFRGVHIAVEICEDAWIPERPALRLADAGIDLVLNPAASHFAFGKQALRRGIVTESSRSFGTVYATVNLLGCESGRMIYDGGAMVASNGLLVLETPRFSFRDRILARTRIDLDQNRVVRGRLYSYKKQNLEYPEPEILEIPLRAEGESSSAAPLAGAPGAGAAAQAGAGVPEEIVIHTGRVTPIADRSGEFYGAVTLGLFDYLRKSHAKGIVISLSGGADSAACAVLAQRMIARAVEELGPEGTLERLGLESLREELDKVRRQGKPTAAYFVRFFSIRLLHTIYQATDQSSTITRDAAHALARELQTDHHEVNVQSMMDGYRTSMEELLKRPLTWERDDLALQNIQARVRSPMAWMLANTTNSLLIVTSNRSEAAVGYCTMDGDTSGGLAPIAGVDKAFIRIWLAHMETTGEAPGGPIPALNHVTAQAPTAELRPLEQKQTDEADLMPYEILDRIEKLAIRDRKSPREVFDVMRVEQAAAARAGGGPIDPAAADTLKNHIRRFFSLWCRNQWKRERYAPSFHLDDENLDPRTWYRFPILSGGYLVELAELDD